MRVGLIYYSRSGRTRDVANYVKDSLIRYGLHVDLYELKCERYRYNFLLILIDTLLGRIIKFSGVEQLNPASYELLIVGTPIWVGRVAPPMRSFLIKYKDVIKTDTACYTTSNLRKGYSKKLRRFMEGLNYNVSADVSIVDLQADKNLLDGFISDIITFTTAATSERRLKTTSTY